MKRDQLVFLVIGIVLGAVLGGVIGVVAVRPELVGAAPASAPTSASQDAAQGMGQSASTLPPEARLEELREQLARNPQDPHALVGLAQQFWRMQRGSEAMAHADRAVQFAGADAHIYFSAAEVFAQANNFGRALEILKVGLQHDKQSYAPAEAAFGMALLKIGDLDAAQELLAEMGARASGPEQVVPAKQRLDQIRLMLETAETKPGDYDAQVRAGNFFYDTRQWDKSAAYYGRARNIRQDDPNMLTDYGTVLAELGRFGEAYELFGQSLIIKPDHWMAAFNGTIISIQRGDGPRANEWVSRLRVANPNHPQLASLESQARSLTGN